MSNSSLCLAPSIEPSHFCGFSILAAYGFSVMLLFIFATATIVKTKVIFTLWGFGLPKCVSILVLVLHSSDLDDVLSWELDECISLPLVLSWSSSIAYLQGNWVFLVFQIFALGIFTARLSLQFEMTVFMVELSSSFALALYIRQSRQLLWFVSLRMSL